MLQFTLTQSVDPWTIVPFSVIISTHNATGFVFIVSVQCYRVVNIGRIYLFQFPWRKCYAQSTQICWFSPWWTMLMCEYQVKGLMIKPNPIILGSVFCVETAQDFSLPFFYGVYYSCYDFVFFIFPPPACIIYFYAVCVEVLNGHLKT